MTWADRLIARVRRREPDHVIGGRDRPYLRRWWLIPRNRIFNVYLHQFLRSDDDRALHDHPWLFNASFLLRGSYVEHTVEAGGVEKRTHRGAGDRKFRWGPAPYRVELYVEPAWDGETPMSLCWSTPQPRPCWTLFITGPVVRQWGFHCPREGWIHWKRFTAPHDSGEIGAGCDA